MKKLNDEVNEGFDICFDDLNPETQEQLLNFLQIKTPSELNLDTIPLFTYHRQEVKDVAEQTINNDKTTA